MTSAQHLAQVLEGAGRQLEHIVKALDAGLPIERWRLADVVASVSAAQRLVRLQLPP